MPLAKSLSASSSLENAESEVIFVKAWTRWQDWATVVLGVILLFTPWLFGTATSAFSSWNAWVVGIVVVILALVSLGAPTRSVVTEWLTLIVGAWLFISPWVLSFTVLTAAAWVAWIIGLLLVVASGWTLLEARRPHMGAAA
jgi:hypothetical protein